MKSFLKKNGLLIGIATLVTFLDQLTKTVVRQNLAIGETWMPWDWLAPYVRFVHWQNTGAAFGIFQNANLILTVLSIGVSLVIIGFYQKIDPKDMLLKVAVSMQFGGALGNLVDRFKLGHVTDFFSVGTFPVFNIADASVTIGVSLLLLSFLLHEDKVTTEHNESASAALTDEATGHTDDQPDD